MNQPPWERGVKIMTPQPSPNGTVSSPGDFLARLRLWARGLTVDILIVAAFSKRKFQSGYFSLNRVFLMSVSLTQRPAWGTHQRGQFFATNSMKMYWFWRESVSSWYSPFWLLPHYRKLDIIALIRKVDFTCILSVHFIFWSFHPCFFFISQWYFFDSAPRFIYFLRFMFFCTRAGLLITSLG